MRRPRRCCQSAASASVELRRKRRQRATRVSAMLGVSTSRADKLRTPHPSPLPAGRGEGDGHIGAGRELVAHAFFRTKRTRARRTGVLSYQKNRTPRARDHHKITSPSPRPAGRGLGVRGPDRHIERGRKLVAHAFLRTKRTRAPRTGVLSYQKKPNAARTRPSQDHVPLSPLGGERAGGEGSGPSPKRCIVRSHASPAPARAFLPPRSFSLAAPRCR